MTDADTTDAAAAPAADSPEAQGWNKDASGRYYVPARGRSGTVLRKGNETPEEAHARDAKAPRDTRPKSKPKTAPKAPAPTQVSLKELEFALTEALQSPSMIAAMSGDQWAADHFVRQAPALARNLTVAAEHNPWLRSKLEAVMTGDVFLMRVMTIFPVAAALVSYAIPPIIYYLNPGFIPEGAREMFQVPDRDELRRKREEEARAEAAASAERAKAERPQSPVAAAA